MFQVCLYFVYIAIVAFFASYAEFGLWMWTGQSAHCQQHMLFNFATPQHKSTLDWLRLSICLHNV